MDIQLELLQILLTERESLFRDTEYDKYVGRNRRMKLFIQEISPYIYNNKKIDSTIVDYCENKLYDFRNTPFIDKSIKGKELHELEHNILGNSIDYIKTN